jgi:hypothetical protein
MRNQLRCMHFVGAKYWKSRAPSECAWYCTTLRQLVVVSTVTALHNLNQYQLENPDSPQVRKVYNVSMETFARSRDAHPRLLFYINIYGVTVTAKGAQLLLSRPCLATISSVADR